MDTSKKIIEINFNTGSNWWQQKPTEKYEELWIKIKDLTRSITNNSDIYDEKYMKIKFHLDE